MAPFRQKNVIRCDLLVSSRVLLKKSKIASNRRPKNVELLIHSLVKNSGIIPTNLPPFSRVRLPTTPSNPKELPPLSCEQLASSETRRRSENNFCTTTHRDHWHTLTSCVSCIFGFIADTGAVDLLPTLAPPDPLVAVVKNGTLDSFYLSILRAHAHLPVISLVAFSGWSVR